MEELLLTSDMNATPARQRNRASAACTSCRKSRIRCALEPGQTICSQCQTSGHECVFDDKDGRKSRGSSKAFADGLCQRIEHLEKLLQQHGAQKMDPKASIGNLKDEGNFGSDPQNGAGSSVIDGEERNAPPTESEASSAPLVGGLQGGSKPNPSHGQSLVRKLVPSPVKFDMASGRVRFFGPTTNMNLLSGVNMSKSLERQESHWPVAMLVRDLSSETHDYLMDLYWTCHNSVFHIVHKDAFYDDLERGGTQFYSIFLHFCMLAIGFRYADKTREDVARLSTTTRPPYPQSTLHVKAKAMVNLELERPGGIPSIQALYLLGDLECMVGRDDLGWMLAGMSFRLVFDVGLHVDASELQLTEREAQIRHMVLWACIINDKYYSIYMGRPSYFKASDIAPSCLSKDFGRLISCRPSGHEKSPETRIYESLLQLMELVGPICDLDVKRSCKTTDAYFKIAAADKDLTTWLSELPEDLKWTPENIAKLPPSFYLLHSQYHTALILLHRPFVKYGEPDIGVEVHKDSEMERMNHFTMLSRTVCADNAKRVASIMSQYRERFDLAQCFLTGLQHTGTAATAIMAELVIQSNAIERKELLGHLACLKQTLTLMSRTYQPAVLMSSVVEAFVREFNRGKENGNLFPPTESFGGKAVSSGLPEHFPSASISTTRKRVYHDVTDSFGVTKRSRFDSYSGTRGTSPKGLPSLPTSWLEEMDFDDTEFLNLMGLKDVQNSYSLGLLSSSNFPGDGHFDSFSSHPA